MYQPYSNVPAVSIPAVRMCIVIRTCEVSAGCRCNFSFCCIVIRLYDLKYRFPLPPRPSGCSGRDDTALALAARIWPLRLLRRGRSGVYPPGRCIHHEQGGGAHGARSVQGARTCVPTATSYGKCGGYFAVQGPGTKIGRGLSERRGNRRNRSGTGPVRVGLCEYGIV